MGRVLKNKIDMFGFRVLGLVADCSDRMSAKIALSGVMPQKYE